VSELKARGVITVVKLGGGRERSGEVEAGDAGGDGDEAARI